MPTMEDLGKLATELYKEHPSVGAKQNIGGLTLDTSKASSMGFTSSYFNVWSGEERNSEYGVYYRSFSSSGMTLYSNNCARKAGSFLAVCLGD